VRHRGHFPTEQAALKVLYLVATQKRPNRENLIGKTNG
jgi:transposase-like protein